MSDNASQINLVGHVLNQFIDHWWIEEVIGQSGKVGPKEITSIRDASDSQRLSGCVIKRPGGLGATQV